MLRLHLLQFIKFAGVLLFVGGALTAFLARDLETRRSAVHRIGSAGLLATWVAGYLLARTLGWSIRAPWLVGAFATTLAANLVLTWSVARDDRRRGPAGVAVAALLLATLALMIWKPR